MGILGIKNQKSRKTRDQQNKGGHQSCRYTSGHLTPTLVYITMTELGINVH